MSVKALQIYHIYQNWPLLTHILRSSEQFDIDSYEHKFALAVIGEKAARDAGVPAYWVASSCTSPAGKETELENDVSLPISCSN